MAKNKALRAKPNALVPIEDLAKSLDVSEETIRKWLRADCPHQRGKLPGSGHERILFDLQAVRDWHKARRGDAQPGKMGRPSAADSAPADVKEATAVANLRKLVAQAERYEHRLAIDRGQFLPAAEVQAGRIARVQAIAQGLASLPARVSVRAGNRDPREVEMIVKEEVDRLREEFAREPETA